MVVISCVNDNFIFSQVYFENKKDFMSEKYSIHVYENVVEIFGELTIEEAFDFLNFFEKKGYKSLSIGLENTTLRMTNKDQQKEIIDQRILDLKDEVNDYKKFLESEQDRHEKTKYKLKEAEVLIKNIIEEVKK